MDKVFDVVAEAGVVGTILNSPEFIFQVEFLKARHFYERINASVYYVVQKLYEEGLTEFDNFTIINKINSNKDLANIFKQYNIKDIGDYFDNAKLVARSDITEFKQLCVRIVTLSYKRDANKKLISLGNECLSTDKDLNELNLHIQNEVERLAQEYVTDTIVEFFGEKVDDLWEEICDTRTESGIPGFPSKYDILNDYFSYQESELIIVSGREKSGKSMFFNNEAMTMVKRGVPTAIFDTEMNDKRFLIRCLSLLSGVTNQKIERGSYSVSEEEMIKEARQWLKKQPFVHIYDDDWTKEKIYIKAKLLKIKMNLGFLIYDYIKVNDTSKSKNKEADELGDMSTFLKNTVASKLNIAVLAGAQQSPYDLRLSDSAKISRYASTVCYWVPKTSEELAMDGATAGNFKFIIDRNRLGQQMNNGEYASFIFDGNRSLIRQAESQPGLIKEELPI